MGKGHESDPEWRPNEKKETIKKISTKKLLNMIEKLQDEVTGLKKEVAELREWKEKVANVPKILKNLALDVNDIDEDGKKVENKVKELEKKVEEITPKNGEGMFEGRYYMRCGQCDKTYIVDQNPAKCQHRVSLETKKLIPVCAECNAYIVKVRKGRKKIQRNAKRLQKKIELLKLKEQEQEEKERLMRISCLLCEKTFSSQKKRDKHFFRKHPLGF